MIRLSKVALVTLLSCLLLLLVAWAVRWTYFGYTRTQEERVEFDAKIENLQRLAHPQWRVRKGTFSITTTDRPQISKYSGDFRLVYGTNAVQRFEHVVWKEPGRIVTAWVSDWTPRSEMAKFEQFSVLNGDGAKFTIVAKAHTNQSVAMEFTVTFIDE